MEERPALADAIKKPIINAIHKIDADVSFREKKDRVMRWVRGSGQPNP